MGRSTGGEVGEPGAARAGRDCDAERTRPRPLQYLPFLAEDLVLASELLQLLELLGGQAVVATPVIAVAGGGEIRARLLFESIAKGASSCARSPNSGAERSL